MTTISSTENLNEIPGETTVFIPSLKLQLSIDDSHISEEDLSAGLDLGLLEKMNNHRDDLMSAYEKANLLKRLPAYRIH